MECEFYPDNIYLFIDCCALLFFEKQIFHCQCFFYTNSTFRYLTVWINFYAGLENRIFNVFKNIEHKMSLRALDTIPMFFLLVGVKVDVNPKVGYALLNCDDMLDALVPFIFNSILTDYGNISSAIHSSV